MLMFCTAGQLKWAGLGVKGEAPQLHRAKQADCQSEIMIIMVKILQMDIFLEILTILYILKIDTHIGQSRLTVNLRI